MNTTLTVDAITIAWPPDLEGLEVSELTAPAPPEPRPAEEDPSPA